MSQLLISHNADLRKLRDHGYEVKVSSNGYLLIYNVPYVNSRREVVRGILASKLNLAGNKTMRPDDHVVLFVGDHPCQQNGTEITGIKHTQNQDVIDDGVRANHSFSNKPPNGYADYYDKMTRYIDIISAPARSLDPNATAQTYKPVPDQSDDGVFEYLDTASSRIGIVELNNKLSPELIGIIGLGGTGSYVLDLVAKTPVREIHLFDGDLFLQHNAFRAPGAASLQELEKQMKKVHYLKGIYSKMRKGIFAHERFIDEDSLSALEHMTFVFICMDVGPIKRAIMEVLEQLCIPFVDVGMGVHFVEGDNTLVGMLRVTASSRMREVSTSGRISFDEATERGEYESNIQIAELNALNAALAVIKWKKIRGFYQDLKNEHHSTYSVNVNLLTSDDIAETEN